METIEAKYDEQAREAGVYIVSACAFDCIPNDLGALLLQRTFSGELAYVESYMTTSDEVRRDLYLPLYVQCNLHAYVYHIVIPPFALCSLPSILEHGSPSSAV